MTPFSISAATLLAWLLVLAFLGAGIVNATGSAAIKNCCCRCETDPVTG